MFSTNNRSRQAPRHEQYMLDYQMWITTRRAEQGGLVWCDPVMLIHLLETCVHPTERRPQQSYWAFRGLDHQRTLQQRLRSPYWQPIRAILPEQSHGHLRSSFELTQRASKSVVPLNRGCSYPPTGDPHYLQNGLTMPQLLYLTVAMF